MTSHPIALRYPRIRFDMPIMGSILELERLRYPKLQDTTHPTLFSNQLALYPTETIAQNLPYLNA